MYSFVAKEAITTKKDNMEIVSIEKEPLRSWSPSSTVSSAAWMPSAIGMVKRK